VKIVFFVRIVELFKLAASPSPSSMKVKQEALARKLKEQDPVWVRGNPPALTAISVGEYARPREKHYG